MGLENPTYIGDFVGTNPEDTDFVVQGAAHTRNIKQVLQVAFPLFIDATTGVLNLTAQQIEDGITDAESALQEFNGKAGTGDPVNYDPATQGDNDYNIEQIQDVGFGGTHDVAVGVRNFIADADYDNNDTMWADFLIDKKYSRSYISGFGITHTAATTIDIASGSCRDTPDAVSMDGLAMTGKVISTNWTDVGNGGGLKPTALSLTTDTWYRLFAIGKVDGTVNYGIDTAANSAAAGLLADANVTAANYTTYRRIGWLYWTNSGTEIKAFTMQDEDVWWDVETEIEKQTTSSTGNSDSGLYLLDTLAPPDSVLYYNLFAHVNDIYSTGGGHVHTIIYLHPATQPATSEYIAARGSGYAASTDTERAFDYDYNNGEIPADGNGQIYFRVVFTVPGGAANIYHEATMNSLGYRDTRDANV